MSSPSFRRNVIIGVIVFFLLSVVGTFFLWHKNRPFNVPTGVMDPTIPAGGFVTVDESAYRNPEEIKRGDVITFNTPDRVYENHPGKENLNQIYVFRVMGIPGDHLKISELGVVVVNGQPIESRVVDGKHEEFQ